MHMRSHHILDLPDSSNSNHHWFQAFRDFFNFGEI